MSRIRLLFRAPPFRSSDSLPSGSREVAWQFQHELPLRSRIRWSYLWYGGVLALGITTGLGARQFVAPFELATSGSREDKLLLQSLGQDIDRMDIVQSLRKQSFNLHSDTPITGKGSADKLKPKGWVEVDVDLVKDAKVDELGGKGILGAMSGSQGLGVQRAFWNVETKEMVAVIWIGGGLAGWPSVAHGGAVATIFEETMARMVRGPVGAIEPVHRPTSISISYQRPTQTLDFYILRASFTPSTTASTASNLPHTESPPKPETESSGTWLSWDTLKQNLTGNDQSKQQTEITATLEDMKGNIKVRVKGAFAVPAPV